MVEMWGFGTRDGVEGLVKPFVGWSVCTEEYESVMLEKSEERWERGKKSGDVASIWLWWQVCKYAS